MKSYLLMLVLLAVVGLSPVVVAAADNPVVSSTSEMIHLNQATAEQLQVLPGVGPALSERIVLYRSEYGPFRSVDQLAEVKGIGQAKLATLKSQLTVD